MALLYALSARLEWSRLAPLPRARQSFIPITARLWEIGNSVKGNGLSLLTVIAPTAALEIEYQGAPRRHTRLLRVAGRARRAQP
jgi:hypothetical protein